MRFVRNNSQPYHMTRRTVIEAISILLLIFFAYTSTSTYIQIKSLQNMAGFYTAQMSLFAWTILGTYVLITTFLFFRNLRTIGLILGIACCVTLYIIIKKTPHSPHDFGGIFNQINNKERLYLLLIIITISAIALTLKYFDKKKGKTTQQSKSSIAITQ